MTRNTTFTPSWKDAPKGCTAHSVKMSNVSIVESSYNSQYNVYNHLNRFETGNRTEQYLTELNRNEHDIPSLNILIQY